MRSINGSSPVRIKAFTLIELLTVIAIIGILAAILIPVVGQGPGERPRGAMHVEHSPGRNRHADVCRRQRRRPAHLRRASTKERSRRPIGSSGGGRTSSSATALSFLTWEGRLLRRSTAALRTRGSKAARCLPYRFSYSLNRAVGEFSSSPRFAGPWRS
jgi:prepilin-type N-terminal cleavage/methylation domain-containing protein